MFMPISIQMHILILDPEDLAGEISYMPTLFALRPRDYMTRYAPVENFLASEITNTGTKSLAGAFN